METQTAFMPAPADNHAAALATAISIDTNGILDNIEKAGVANSTTLKVEVEVPPVGTIKCLECGEHHKTLARHLKTHGITVATYRLKHPNAPTVADGVQVGRRKGAAKLKTTSADPTLADSDLANLLAGASEIKLVDLAHAALDRFTKLNSTIEAALNGRSDESGAALAVGYAFAIQCIEQPQDAARLSEWEMIEVKEGANPWYHPLKWCCRDATSIDTHRLTMIAAVFRDAHKRKIVPANFVATLKREKYLRNWYDSLPKSSSSLGKKGATTKGAAAPLAVTSVPTVQSAAPMETAPVKITPPEAAAMLNEQGFGKEPETLSTEEARKLLAEQGFETEPEHLTQEQGKAMFPPPLVLVVWRADQLPAVKDVLAVMEGFVQVLEISSTEVAKIVKQAGSK